MINAGTLDGKEQEKEEADTNNNAYRRGEIR